MKRGCMNLMLFKAEGSGVRGQLLTNPQTLPEPEWDPFSAREFQAYTGPLYQGWTNLSK